MSKPAAVDRLVSTVIPVFNAASFIARAVDSVLAQTYPNVEIIVVNDGSTDDTGAHLLAYGHRIRVIEQENAGLSAARNAGIRATRGDLVAFLDADDWWLPSKLERQVALLDANPRLGFCSTCARVVDGAGNDVNVWGCPNIDGDLLHTIFAQNAAVPGSGSGVVVRRALLDRVGPFDVELRSLEDIDMWLRLAAVCDYGCIDEALTVIERRATSMSSDLEVMRDQALWVMRKNRKLLPPRDRGGFWRYAYAGVLTDYAKWEYRAGRTLPSTLLLIRALALSPVRRVRLVLGLLVAFLRRQQV